jgi:hypothetical protein
LRKTSICTKGYVEILIQRPFLDNKQGIWEIFVLKIQTSRTCFCASSIHGFFFFLKMAQKSQFLVVIQSLFKFIVFE